MKPSPSPSCIPSYNPTTAASPVLFFMGYTDAHERVNALGYAADLIAPTAGLRWLSR
jgi:hypothetical protein